MMVLPEFGVTGAPNQESGGSVPPPRHEPVTRRYRPQPAALDELVEVLYRLLIDVPAPVPCPASVAAESTCFPVAHK